MSKLRDDLDAEAFRLARKQEVANRLKRVEGQVRGVLGMIERDAPCDAVAQQLAAARKALDRAFYEMLACSLESGLADADDAAKQHQVIQDTTRLLAKYA